MNSVRFHPTLAGAAALALVLSAPALAQAQTQAAQPADPAATAQVTAENATNAGAAGQVVQQLEAAQLALEAGDMDAAREAVGQANEMLQKAMVEGTEQQMVEIQAQLEQANTALEQEDAEAAQAALLAAAEGMIAIEQESTSATSAATKGQATTQATGQQTTQTTGQQSTQTTGQQATDQQPMQATGQQATSQQPAAQATVVQGDAPSGQINQEAVWNAQNALEMARQELEAAMRSVEEAQAALQQIGTAGAQGNAQLTVVEGGSTNAQTQPATGQAQGRLPRLSQEETYRMLGIGDRQVGEASEMRQVTVADINDRDVHTFEGEKLGEIDAFVTSGGQVYAIIEHGGFLGIGEDKVAIPANRLGMRGDEIILLGLTEEQLEQMPEYDFAAGEELNDEDPFEIGIYN